MRRLAAVGAGALLLAGCGGGGSSGSAQSSRAQTVVLTVNGQTRTVARTTAKVPRKPSWPSYPVLLHAATGTQPTPFVPAVKWHGETAAWVARSPSGVGLLSFNQRLVVLHLHSGTIDAGAAGWRFGPTPGGVERARLVSAFNGGFKLDVGAGGFMMDGRVGSTLQPGLASIVTYTDGVTDIGSWQHGVPQAGRHVASVRQNLNLLIDNGQPAASVGCDSCWGATLGGVSDPARSALGITAHGNLIWAGGVHLTVQDLVNALRGANVVRAVELDINPEWVAAYLYGHRGGHGPLAPVPVVPGQSGVPGQFLEPYSRDFFTIAAR
jgi:hypothetical protein